MKEFWNYQIIFGGHPDKCDLETEPPVSKFDSACGEIIVTNVNIGILL